MNIESSVIYVNDPVFSQKGNIPPPPKSAPLFLADSWYKNECRHDDDYFDLSGGGGEDDPSKDEWIGDLCHPVSKTDSVPTHTTDPNNNFQSEIAKTPAASSDQKSASNKIRNQFSPVPIWWSMIQQRGIIQGNLWLAWLVAISQTHKSLDWLRRITHPPPPNEKTQ